MPSFSRKDNKPLTLRDLLAMLGRTKVDKPKVYEKMLDKPVTMSSDEEGNDMLKLVMVDIESKGVTLWPAHL
jgi:hypothetical protein